MIALATAELLDPSKNVQTNAWVSNVAGPDFTFSRAASAGVRSPFESLEQLAQKKPIQKVKEPVLPEKEVQVLGLRLATLNDELRHRYGIKAGIAGAVITEVDPNSETASHNLLPGEVVIEFGGLRLNDAAAIEPQLQKLRADGKKVVLLFLSNPEGETRFVALRITTDAVPDSSASHLSSKELELKLEECGDACPDNPELEKIRRDSLEQVEQAHRAAQDANRFAAALGNQQALEEYISTCAAFRCAFRADAVSERDALLAGRKTSAQAEAEQNSYRSASGDQNALKQYIAECTVCAFAQDALAELKDLQSRQAERVFQLEVCNHDFVPVYAAFAGQPDPDSRMWIAQGWYTINSGECKTIGTLAKGTFFVVAQSQRGLWDGEKRFCTSIRRSLGSSYRRAVIAWKGNDLQNSLRKITWVVGLSLRGR